ncbi:hypothetical protein [Bradyrhizobium diazoefficiens]
MNFKSLLLAAGFAAAAAGASLAADLSDKPVKAKPIADVPFFFVNDNRITYAYQFTATDPGVTDRTAKQTYAFTHFDAWAYGTNLINMSLFKSDHADPAGPCPVAVVTGCAGATEFFGTLRSTFGWNQIFDTHAFTAGPLHNVSFEVGADGGTMNTFLAPNKKVVVAGLQFAFDLPYRGFFNVAPLYYQEWNHNAFLQTGAGFLPPALTGLPDGNTHFKGTWALELNYYMDLGFLPQEFQYFAISGRAAFYGPKGSGAYGAYTVPARNETTTEINSEPIRLTFDASKLAWGPKYSHYMDVWVAYRYWQNKFGLNDSNPANTVCFTAAGANNHSCTERSLYSGVTVKF